MRGYFFGVAIIAVAGCSSAVRGGPSGSDKTGLVSVQEAQSIDSNSTSVIAAFLDPGRLSAPPQCNRVQVDPCYVDSCFVYVNDVSAGDLSVMGGSSTIQLGPANGYLPSPATRAIWAPGDSVDVTAVGDMVPAFHGTLQMPEIVTLTAPSSITKITAAQGITFTWNAASRGQVVVRGLGGQDQLVCTFDATAGQGTIPPAILEQVPQIRFLFTLESVDGSTISAGDYQVRIEGRIGLVTTGNRLFTFNATID